MATDRQIAANRLNSKKSTGPKSDGGKRRARLNARIHGLAGQSPMDAQWVARVEQLAREIVDSTGGRIDLTCARSIAQAEQELMRARSMASAMAANLCAAHLEGDGPSGGTPKSREAHRSTQLASLLVFDRYEHRALKRRNRAIRSCFVA